jgi:ABC-type multidrug transport system fused ATPase/permease subunit
MQQETTFFDDPKVILAKPDAPAPVPSLRPKDSGQVLGATTILDNDIRTLQSTITDKLPASVGHIIRCALMLQQKPSFVTVPATLTSRLSRTCSVLACLGFIFAISWKLTIVMIALTPVAAFAQVASSRVRASIPIVINTIMY